MYFKFWWKLILPFIHVCIIVNFVSPHVFILCPLDSEKMWVVWMGVLSFIVLSRTALYMSCTVCLFFVLLLMCGLGWEVGCGWGLGWVICVFWGEFGFFSCWGSVFLSFFFFFFKSSPCETYLMMKGANSYSMKRPRCDSGRILICSCTVSSCFFYF